MPRLANWAPARGFSRLELVIVIALISVLLATAAWRLLPLRGAAEVTHVATVTGALHSALGLAAAEAVVQEGAAGLARLDRINPMTLLQDIPGSYTGEIDTIAADTIVHGQWYFVSATATLGYRVRFPRYLVESPPRPVDLQWQVVLDFDDHDGSGRFNPATDRARGLHLVPVGQHPGW